MSKSIESVIPKLIMEVLAVEESEVVPDARFFQDLNGESIDLLDLGFKIEKAFGVRAQFQNLFGSSQMKTDPRGVFTPDAIAWLRAEFAFLNTAKLPVVPREDDLKGLLTVRAICEFVRNAAPIADCEIASNARAQA